MAEWRLCEIKINKMATIKTSKKGRLNKRDIAKAALMAALTPVFVLIQQSLAEGHFTFHWKSLSMAAIGGLVAYLLKNFFTPSQIVLTGEDVDKVVDERKKISDQIADSTAEKSKT